MNFSEKGKKTDNFLINQPNSRDIAIVGMACRFPEANNYIEFWDNLKKGKNSIQEITPDRWNIDEYYDEDPAKPNKIISKWGGLLEDNDKFDAPFFNISPREAIVMDPQQRILLEEMWHCIEDSGIPLDQLQKNTSSVYVGVMAIDYQHHFFNAEHITTGYECLGNYEGIIANRLSYFFNLNGPSQTIDAACASSLVCVHSACSSIILGESDFAFTAGVSLINHPWRYIAFSKSNMLSPDGQCKTFDADANGYVPGEGVGMLMLCSLEKAISNGYRIHGVIKGSAIKHTGQSNSIVAPRVEIERQVIEEALAISGVSAEEVTYIEAHGTGTSLGDPIEIEALTQAFHTDKTQYCSIGSVKTNIGHLEAASGVAGLIKILLMMNHRQIPKTLNIQTVNPIIDFENSPFKPAQKLSEWDLPDTISKRYAGVSSFGFGGVNAHVILEEYIHEDNVNPYTQSGPIPFMLSAKSPASLKQLIEKWQHYVQTEEFLSQTFEQICQTLAIGREMLPFRFGKMVHDKINLVDALVVDKVVKATDTSLVLYLRPLPQIDYAEFKSVCNQYPVLTALLIEVETHLKKITKNDQYIPKIEYENAPEFQQFRNYILLYILSKALLISRVKVSYVGGEGVGELVAAVISGMLDFESGFSLLRDTASNVELKRPKINFYTRQTEIIPPYKLPDNYCDILLNDLCIDKASEDNLIKHVRQLFSCQFTFKKFLNEWQPGLELYGSNIEQSMEQFESLKPSQRSLYIVIFAVCLKKLNQKWSLSEKFIVRNEGVQELIDLVVDGVLTYEDAIGLILDSTPEARKRITQHIQQKLDTNKKYPLIAQLNERCDEIKDTKIWVETMLHEPPVAINPQAALGNSSFFVVVGTPTPYLPGVSFEPSLLIPALLGLWCQNMPIDWKQWYLVDNYHPVTLPNYPFEKISYWYTQLTKPAELLSKPTPLPLTKKMVLQPLPIKKVTTPEPQPSPIEEKIQQELIQPESFKDTRNIKNQLRALIADVLYMPENQVDDERSFKEHGMDSITGIEFVNKINKAFEISINVTKLYEFPSLNQLEEVVSQLINKIVL